MIRISVPKRRDIHGDVVAENLQKGEVLPFFFLDATSFVWSVSGSRCKCGENDGTVDCECGTALEFYKEALVWIEKHKGEFVKDPGYFDN